MAKLTYNGVVLEGFNKVKLGFSKNNHEAVLAVDTNKVIKIPKATYILVEGFVNRVNAERTCIVIGDVTTAKSMYELSCEGIIKGFPQNQSINVDRDIRVVYGHDKEYQDALNSGSSSLYEEIVGKKRHSIIHVEGNLEELICNLWTHCYPVVLGPVREAIGHEVRVKGNIEYAESQFKMLYSTMGKVPPKDYKALWEQRLENQRQADQDLRAGLNEIFGKMKSSNNSERPNRGQERVPFATFNANFKKHI